MRIAVVVQRYGADLVAGAEMLAAVTAGILAREHRVEVLTTTAREYHRWENSYPPGPTEVAGVPVLRFPVARGREPAWGAVHRLLHDGFDSAEFARLPEAVRAAFAARVRSWPDALQEEFIRGQGPIAPALNDQLRRTPYDRVLFVTYLYPTTYDGLACVPPERALAIPTLHDEPPAYLPVFGRRLARARLLCLTMAEIALIARLYPENPPPASLLGYGIDLEPCRPLPSEAAPAAKGAAAYLLYVGRVDTHKGIPELLEWYARLRQVLRAPPRLVLIGDRAMPVAGQPGVEVRGVVGEEEKFDWMRGALALVHPSPYESLGIVLLEAMGCAVPIVVHGGSEVMVEHCRRGNGGVWVRDAGEFTAAIDRLVRNPELRCELGRSGRLYVEREYSREAYASRLLEVFRAEEKSARNFAAARMATPT
jgi:glycosyltransferase involved in cell wall biosynthesis